jgi:RNA polymerase sigma-70 factor (ECF subfamily)
MEVIGRQWLPDPETVAPVGVVRETHPTSLQKPSDADNRPPLCEEFVTQVAGAQRPLYAYIRSLVGPWADPDDILQEVNLVLCRKADEYDGQGRFLTWACRVAYFQVLARMKQRQREKCRFVDEELLADLAGPLAERVERYDDRLEALQNCLGKLPPTHRRMITARYASGGSVQAVARAEGRSAGSVRVTLHRIRLLLLRCIQISLTRNPTG